eukprot:5252377-Amphidinium_carterae.1
MAGTRSTTSSHSVDDMRNPESISNQQRGVSDAVHCTVHVTSEKCNMRLQARAIPPSVSLKTVRPLLELTPSCGPSCWAWQSIRVGRSP